MIRLSFAVAAIAFLGAAQAADAAKSPCESYPWSMSREETAFAAAPTDATSGSTLTAIPAGTVKLTLKPLADAALPVKPSRTPKDPAKANAGWVTLPALPAGTYQITTNREIWIDPVQDGAAIRSSAHGGEKACKLFHKSVQFALKAGPVTLDFIGPESDITFSILPAQ